MLRDDFAGQNGFVWFTGVVANNQDKAQVGRVRVRIIGWHNENVNLQPDEELPWAQILLPVNNSKSFSSPKPGEWVMGFFQDGQNGQQPVIVGVYPRIVSQKVRTATSDAQSLSALEAQLVEERAKLKLLTDQQVTTNVGGAAFVSPRGLRNDLSNQIIAQQKVILDLENQISTLKSTLNSKPASPWVDRRTQGEINNGPNPPAGVVGYVQDEPTFPRLARSVMEGTIVDKNNKDLAHVCDFISEMQKNINLKKYTKALANQIREAIRAVMKALGFSDATGQYSWILNTLKAFARELRRIQKEIIQPIIDFEKYVLAYIVKVREMISWILGLPERFLTMLNDCLQRLLKLVSSIFTDTFSGLSDGLEQPEIGEIFNAAKDSVNATFELVQSAGIAAAGAQVIVDSATVGLLIPTSAGEVESANTYINSYTTSGNNFISSVTAGLQAP
jgi:hypothetical protein